MGIFVAASKTVVSRVYSNLNQAASPTYVIVGQQVVVNFDKQFEMNVGTISDPIPVSVSTGVETKL
jgi:hypothetical protein